MALTEGSGRLVEKRYEAAVVSPLPAAGPITEPEEALVAAGAAKES